MLIPLQIQNLLHMVAALCVKMRSIIFRSMLELDVASTPDLLSQFAGIIPLACHLASPRYAFQLVGAAALTHRLSVSMFPRLGVFKNIATLLKEGPQFFDRVGSLGTQEVWDVSWGSTFPCANGAASTIVASYAIQQSRRRETAQTSASGNASRQVVEGSMARGVEGTTIATNASRGSFQSSRLEKEGSISSSMVEKVASPEFYRGQELHVLQVSRRQPNISWYCKVIESVHVQNLAYLALIGCAAVMAFCQLYATMAALLIGVLSKIACRFTNIQKPLSFLENNEKHDACMLVAAHRNASVWYLYIGDRGVVDHLLNKDMVRVEPRSALLANYFQLAHILQVIAMAFAAAHRGWDGAVMVLMMLVSWFAEWEFEDRHLAKHWMNKHGIGVEARSFHFGRRTQMICAIHSFSGARSRQWMDSIIVPSLRRDTLLDRLGNSATAPQTTSETLLAPSDEAQICQQKAQVETAVEIIKRAVAGMEDA
ncbi:hypothetical protein F5882DRAFT_418518 [Hyaloscypha sp. PMI_1271]|nr:hypothetical protein F5882DRAFT_418518 [Hyaloscypha sp. PMI_1271]